MPVPYVFTPGKSPSERRSFGFDFSPAPEFQFTGGVAQSIASATVTCDDPSLTIETPMLSGNPDNPLVVSAYINGGVAGTTYSVVYAVTTNQAAVIHRTVLLPVNNL